ncbi:GcrA family cell cycle regulator [Aestuariivirga sp.]|uniref:GcrA family cell cycle regulator n=1 Tax=Aestuariivirga sp. TaxID=2650926 RepID=UPI0025C18CE8|nr:GcrA family cell cycle regulator [Aestuariivirga sp.]
MSWTDERVELLKKLWTEGLSASQIAGRLGNGVTRNAVIGKVHRLNLSGRVQQQRVTAPREPRKQREPSLPPRAGSSMPSMPTAGSAALKPTMRAETHIRPAAIPEPQPLRLVDLPKDGRVTILHLSDKTCKWPIGDPGSEEFCFCGHGPREGSPYCEYHARLAYQPMQDRRNRKVNFG